MAARTGRPEQIVDSMYRTPLLTDCTWCAAGGDDVLKTCEMPNRSKQGVNDESRAFAWKMAPFGRYWRRAYLMPSVFTYLCAVHNANETLAPS
jgi:hypothetical protein